MGDVTRTVAGRTERLLLEMPPDPDVLDATTVMQTIAAAYPGLAANAFVKQPGGPLQVWIPVGMRPVPVVVEPADPW